MFRLQVEILIKHCFVIQYRWLWYWYISWKIPFAYSNISHHPFLKNYWHDCNNINIWTSLKFSSTVVHVAWYFKYLCNYLISCFGHFQFMWENGHMSMYLERNTAVCERGTTIVTWERKEIAERFLCRKVRTQSYCICPNKCLIFFSKLNFNK